MSPPGTNDAVGTSRVSRVSTRGWNCRRGFVRGLRFVEREEERPRIRLNVWNMTHLLREVCDNAAVITFTGNERSGRSGDSVTDQ